MITYAKIINQETGLCEVGMGTNYDFYSSIGMVLLDVEQSEKDNQWYLSEKCPHYTQEEKEQQERQRLDSLTLTPSDVERALYYRLGMDFDDLKALIQEQAPTIDMKGLAIEFRANNFYRGAVDINGNRIVDMIGLLLGYNSNDMDYLFENKVLPNKEEE